MTLSPDTFRLPEADADAQRVSATLVRSIREHIQASSGWISFSDFMERALYTPGLGYYSAGSVKLGAAGDFTTAPESGPVFGQILASQLAEILSSMDRGVILELGAGTGKLACQILSQLESLGCLPRAYEILEVSGDLRQVQRNTLEQQVPHLMERVRWRDSLLSNEIEGVILANEVLDALPVDRFQIDDYGVIQNVGVGLEGDAFVDAKRPASGVLLSQVRSIQKEFGEDWANGFQSELCVNVAPWLRTVLGGLSRGVALFIDYGLPRREYYLADRNRGTLLAYYRHRANQEFYQRVGLQDITAWVDFTGVAEVAQSEGCDVAGFTTQAHFLMAAGVDLMQSMLQSLDDPEKLKAVQQIKTLLMPGEMGERFKVMALTKDVNLQLKSFELNDMRHRL